MSSLQDQIHHIGKNARAASRALAQLDSKTKNAILVAMADELIVRLPDILEANAAVNATGQTQPYSIYVWPHWSAFTASEKPGLVGLSRHRRLMLVVAPHATGLNLPGGGLARLARVTAQAGFVATGSRELGVFPVHPPWRIAVPQASVAHWASLAPPQGGRRGLGERPRLASGSHDLGSRLAAR